MYSADKTTSTAITQRILTTICRYDTSPNIFKMICLYFSQDVEPKFFSLEYGSSIFQKMELYDYESFQLQK